MYFLTTLHVAADDTQESLTSRYDNETENVEHRLLTHFESVVIADVDAHTPAKELRAAAVHHAKTMGRPFVQVAHCQEHGFFTLFKPSFTLFQLSFHLTTYDFNDRS